MKICISFYMKASCKSKYSMKYYFKIILTMGIFYVPCKFKVIRGIQNLHNIGSKTNLDNNVLH